MKCGRSKPLPYQFEWRGDETVDPYRIGGRVTPCPLCYLGVFLALFDCLLDFCLQPEVYIVGDGLDGFKEANRKAERIISYPLEFLRVLGYRGFCWRRWGGLFVAAGVAEVAVKAWVVGVVVGGV